MPEVRLRVVDQNWSGAGRREGHLAAKRGPKQNTRLAAKQALRKWIARQLPAVESVYEVFGPGFGAA